MRCCGSLDNFDKRIYIFYTYSSFKKHIKIALNYVSQEQFNIMNQTLIIKDFIIIGNEKFHSEIKSFENNIIHEKILYLSTITQVRNNLVNYTSKKIKYRNFSYIVIIDDKDIEKYLKELFLIMHEFSLVRIVIIYIKDLNILINKNILMNSKNIPIYFACNIIEIKNFIISQKYCNCGKNFIDISLKMRQKVDVILKNYSPRKINIFSSKVLIFDKLSSEDGWELVDLIPKEMFENKYLEISGRISVNTISLNLLELFKEDEDKSLFYERYCPYFNFCLLPEINSSKYLSIVLKQICYAYSLDEGKKSFYYFLNRNLRSGDLSIIEKYHILISVFNRVIEEKMIKSYEGEVFRATQFDIDFIKNEITVGKFLTNLSFWSATKERKKVEFFLAQEKKNILFLIKTKNYNIDIDLEHLYCFDEKEVLFLPYSKFFVKSKEKKIFKNKEIYEVKLEELDKMNDRGNIKSLHISQEEFYGIMEMSNNNFI